MMNYIIYESEFWGCVVEILNETEQDLFCVQRDLTNKGYVITAIYGKFIKCHKVEEKED